MWDKLDLIEIWVVVAAGMIVSMYWILVVALRTALRRNEYLATLIAVGNAHGGKGTDAARAQVAAVRELKKKSDKIAAGVTGMTGMTGTPQKTQRPGLKLRQKTP